jgi:hypothetical protein
MRLGPRLFGPRSALGAALLPLLIEAHRLFAAGQPAEAARLFAQLAEKAEADGNLPRAAQMHLEAARSLLMVNDGQAAVAHARAALQLFTQIGSLGPAEAVYQRTLQELRARGMRAEADALEQDLRSEFSQAAAPPAPGVTPSPARGRLPVKCPQCGGPMRGDEVEWIDDHSAECLYCGSVVQAG